MTRKIIALGLAVLAVIGVVVAAIGFAGGYAKIDHIPPGIAQPTGTPAGDSSPAPSTAAYTEDATPANIPTSWPANDLAIKTHNIRVWMAAAVCMKKAGFDDFHYRIFWKIQDITADSELFWLAGKSSRQISAALTAENGPTHVQGAGGCTGNAEKATP
jgi:hypothetical protein